MGSYSNLSKMSTGSHSSSRFSSYSANSGLSDYSQASQGSDNGQSDPNGTMGQYRNGRDRNEAWWSVGEFLEPGSRAGGGITHQSAHLTLKGIRVFGRQEREEVWDLTDSLAELYEESQRSLGPFKQQGAENATNQADIKQWLDKDTNNGFIRVYWPDGSGIDFEKSQLVPVTLSTTAQKVCILLGIPLNALHIQLNGDIIRRLDPYEHPLMIQNDYLTKMGFTDMGRIQEEGPTEEVGYFVRFYSGKPFHDSTYSRNLLQAFIDVRKGKMLTGWTRKLCVISGTRLLIYKDKYKRSKPSILQLAKGTVEEVKIKGHDLCLKLTSTIQGEKIVFLSFVDPQEFTKWQRKCKKATDKLPTSADLSNCHLEYLPETIFINDELAMLNLRHNVLKERPIEEDIYIIGWIDDLPRFRHLRSLNLADNELMTFPPALCQIKTLVELNIASNKLEEIPPEISELTNLQALHVHDNHLHSLPDEMVGLRKLFILVLAFNHFTAIPSILAQMTDVRMSDLENVILAGNQIQKFPEHILQKMRHVKKCDFRMNQLTMSPSETVKFTLLEHLTHLDIRDNQVIDLDIRAVKSLQYLNCERNTMHSLQLNGLALKNLFAAHNGLQKLVINPKPEWLQQIDVSYNRLRLLPEWISDCFFLQKLNASHNRLVGLPQRIFADAKKLRVLRIDHNELVSLPGNVDTFLIEELHIEHNRITQLPKDFLIHANKMRIFNATNNHLVSLPDVNTAEDLNKIQELYLAQNNLQDSALLVIAGYPRLKILHLAYNDIHQFPDSVIRKLELLQELNVSGNRLQSLPESIGDLSKLVVLRAHSNALRALPDLKNAASLKVLDVGHNQLLNVSVTDLMASQINLLDMSLNAQLKVDPDEFRNLKKKKTVCLVDLTGQNKAFPGLGNNVHPALDQDPDDDSNLPWKVGFSETSGIRNKLCVATLKILKFGNENESLFAMFDGFHNNDVPKLLLGQLADIIRKELSHQRTGDKYLKYAMIKAHMRLRSSGQKLGASALLCHIRKLSINQKDTYTLQLANVGDIEAVLCRQGEATKLTRLFTVVDDKEECHRIYRNDGIITEDNKVNGVTSSTRLLGCTYLFPHIVPDPFIYTVAIRPEDEFVIIANQGLWKYLTYSEAVEEVYSTGNPVMAAKRLQDLAQGYGSKENIGVLVVRLNTDGHSTYGKLRKRHRSYSNDEDMVSQSTLRSSSRGRNSSQTIDENESANTLQAHASSSTLKALSVSTLRNTQSDESTIQNSMSTTPEIIKAHARSSSDESVDGCCADVLDSRVDMMDEKLKSTVVPPPLSFADPPLRPLPNQRFRKKNAAAEWEGILQRRLMEDVKDKEVRHSMSQLLGVETENDFPEPEDEVANVEFSNMEREENWSSIGRNGGFRQVSDIDSKTNARSWKVTAPFGNIERMANPAYSLTTEATDIDIINMTTESRLVPSVRSAIAQFENLSRESSADASPRKFERNNVTQRNQPWSRNTTAHLTQQSQNASVSNSGKPHNSPEPTKSLNVGASNSKSALSVDIPEKSETVQSDTFPSPASSRQEIEASNASSIISSLSSLTPSEQSSLEETTNHENVAQVREYMFSDSSLTVQDTPIVAFVKVDVHHAETSSAGTTLHNSEGSSSQSLTENKRKSQDDLTEIGLEGANSQPHSVGIKQAKLDKGKVNGVSEVTAETDATSDTGHIYPTRMTNSNVNVVEITHI